MKKIVSLLLFIGSTVLFAQQKTHKVEPKETVYGISKKYGVTQEELYKANPTIEKNGLQIGDSIIIPGAVTSKNNEQTSATNFEDENFIYLTIQPKESIYQITRKYDVTEATLKSLNPKQLENGLKVGDVIRIPKKSTTTTVTSSKPKETVPSSNGYVVEKGETLYSLSKKFNVSVDDFYAENPQLQTEGLKNGMVINIPKKSGRAVIENNTINYTVQSGDTAYNIINRYNTNLDELLALNPDAINGLKAGMVLKLPLENNAKIIKYAEAGKVKRANDNEINIVLMLPFNADNPTSLKNNQAMQFFTGAKVALNRLTKAGKNINVKVIDTKDENDIQSILSTQDLSKTDAIIGPIKAGAVIEVADFLRGSGIGIISPYATSDELNNYENLLIANPREEVLADQIIEEVSKTFAGEQIYLLTDSDHQELANYTKKTLEKSLKANVVIVNDASKIIQPNDKVGDVNYFTPITAIMVGDNDVLGKQYLERLKTFNKDNIKAFGIKSVDVYDIYDTNNAANIDAFREFGFVFSTSNIMNTRNEETKSILKDFADVYCYLPKRAEQLGYDTVYDIVDRMNSKGDFLNNISAENTRLASKFAYKRVGSSKAYANDSARIIRLPKK
ncbi:LysM peptidoglycan-binding domain-containing protein [Faecalibacter macacae]|uniref:LysM peptidoglycan-binding domain-containing protein n=1 Tax=Faecalibacter macacae TaxID=1859289 RepID=A0A3L9MID0_9FLAO|nr:LysM peptidoglycan-binding domain-containing protein [Faecalibacter macacae]RLZ12608.1 LysM peptidoglycan-binding domain-containing protein [Faecalibacter macacae]